jgi:hypothetical protein
VKPVQNEITGSLGVNPSIELKARLEQDRILGRVGGALMAKELNLEVSEKGVSGRVGGKNGFDVNLELKAGELTGFVGTDALNLRGVDQVVGRLGSATNGVDFISNQHGDSLRGRLGGIKGQLFELELAGTPGWIGTLVAIIAFYAIEKHKN